jgi:hypothetical protein
MMATILPYVYGFVPGALLGAVFGAFWGRKHPSIVNTAAEVANQVKSKM